MTEVQISIATKNTNTINFLEYCLIQRNFPVQTNFDSTRKS